MLEEGQEYAIMLYTWRSCSRAIPQVMDENCTVMQRVNFCLVLVGNYTDRALSVRSEVESALIPELLSWECHRTVSFSTWGPVGLYFFYRASIAIPHGVCVSLTFWLKSIGIMCFKRKTFDCGICLRSTFHSREWTLPTPQFST